MPPGEKKFTARPLGLSSAKALCFGLAYYLSARISVYFSVPTSPFLTFWLPSGLYLAVLILSEYDEWPWLIAATFAANFAFDLHQGNSARLILCFFCANTVTATTAAFLIHKFAGHRPAMASLREVVLLLGFGPVVGAFLGAAFAAGSLLYFGKTDSFVTTALIWWGDNAMSILLLTPSLLAWHERKQLVNRMAHQPAKFLEAVLLAAGAFLALWHVFSSSPAAPVSAHTFEIIPFLLWAGLRFGPRGATLTTFSLALVLAHYTAMQLNHSSASLPEIGRRVFALESMLVVAALAALIPAAILEERDRTLRILRESEEKFSKAFRTSPDVMSITDFDTGHYLEVNAAHEKTFGYRRDEVLGRSPTEIGIFGTPVLRADLLDLLKKQGVFHNIEIETRDRLGHRLVMLHSAELIDLDGRRRVIRVSHDITERKLAEEALRENERMLATLFRNLPGMVYRCHNDIEWTMEFVSDGCRELTGYAPLDLQGNHTVSFGSLIHPWDRPRIHSEVQSALKAQKAFEVIYRIRTSDNREKWVWERGRGISPISPQDGEIEGFITDITETRHAELEREQAIRREQAARIQYTLQLIAAQEAERTRIARELHDSLGQNLLLIKNHAQLALLRASEPKGWQNQMDHISDLVSKAIEEVRQISHNLHPYRIDHLGLTQALTILIDDAARSSGVVFERRIEDIDDVLPPDHAINLYRFIQECINNILKHSQAKKVSIQIERDISELQLEVKDDGHGFDAKLQETTGNGLGLKNMADRVRILHGRFTLDSSPGNGASIRVTIPIPAEKS